MCCSPFGQFDGLQEGVLGEPFERRLELEGTPCVPAYSRDLLHVVRIDCDELIVIVGVDVKDPFQLSLGFLQVFFCSRGNVSAESERDGERG